MYYMSRNYLPNGITKVYVGCSPKNDFMADCPTPMVETFSSLTYAYGCALNLVVGPLPSRAIAVSEEKYRRSFELQLFVSRELDKIKFDHFYTLTFLANYPFKQAHFVLVRYQDRIPPTELFAFHVR